MLQAIREKAQGWIAWAIVILISIPFALWGIQEYLGVGSEPKVAVVDGEDITQRMLDQRTRDFRENLRASLGDAYRADLFEDAVLKAQVRDAMIEERVLTKFARDWNLRTADGQAVGFIASIPAFQRDNRFDQQLYEAAVRNRGMSTAGFEQSVRHDLAVGQLRAGIRDSAFITERTLSDHVRLSDQTRTVRYARLPADSFREGVRAEADAVRAFYDANPERYRKPERLRLAYLVLNAEELTQFVEVDEAGLREYFDAHRAEFVAREEREMRHILVAIPPGSDEAAIKAAQDKAAGLLARLQAGDDFAELARAESDDPGSAANGGDLGWVERGMMVPPFEEAAFALEKMAISELVRTEFGFHIVQVTDARGGADVDFEAVRDKVDTAYRRVEAENLYFDYAERMAEAAYEHAASLTPAAEALGLTIRESDWITREGLPSGVLGSPRVINAAFSEDVLVDGNNSDLIEVAGQQAVVVRVLEHDPAGLRPFTENRETIEADFIADQAAALAAKAGAEALRRLKANEVDLATVASEHSQSVEGPTTVTRNGAALPPGVVAKSFDTAIPQEATSAHAGVAASNGDYYVIAIDAVSDGDPAALDDQRRDLLAERLVREQAEGAFGHVVDELRQRTDIDLLSIGD